VRREERASEGTAARHETVGSAPDEFVRTSCVLRVEVAVGGFGFPPMMV